MKLSQSIARFHQNKIKGTCRFKITTILEKLGLIFAGTHFLVTEILYSMQWYYDITQEAKQLNC
jgi:hypothetical protein